MKTSKKYTDEFKRDALNLQKESGKTVAEIERELGLSHGLLRHWQKRFEVNTESNELELKEIARLKTELKKARRELETVQQERDILKKTVGIFSKDGQR